MRNATREEVISLKTKIYEAIQRFKANKDRKLRFIMRVDGFPAVLECSKRHGYNTIWRFNVIMEEDGTEMTSRHWVTPRDLNNTEHQRLLTRVEKIDGALQDDIKETEDEAMMFQHDYIRRNENSGYNLNFKSEE